MRTVRDFKAGDRVYFGRANGEKTLGEVTKVNSKRLKVKTLEARGDYRDYPVGTVWAVPPSLCVPEAEGKPARVTKAKRPRLVNILTGKVTYGRYGESEDNLFGRMANGL